ncbi:MAG: lamin tail domain-containing protein, partial [Bacteroidetes bacterium]|nr:lamin tail domain-containing protein [Fibrella sp.]
PTELAFNGSTRIISGVLSTTVGSPYSVTITGTDPGGLSASTSFVLTVVTSVSVSPLSIVASADPATILTTGTTTLLGTVSGGTAPYSYTFTGPGSITASGNSAIVSGLVAGVQTFTVVTRDGTSPVSQTASATVSVTVDLPPNTAPEAVASSDRTVTTGVPFIYTVNAFTDAETPDELTYVATGLPTELAFNGRTISGTISTTAGSPYSVTITGTDPRGLSANTSFVLRVIDASTVSSLTGVVISQIWGGGSNVNAFRNDFVELFNRGSVPIPLDGWTVQAASGTGNFSSNIVDLKGTLAPGQYYLIRMGGGFGGPRPLPTPDASNTEISLSSASGKIALVNSTVILGCSNSSPANPCSAANLARIVDLVGYGSTNFFEGSGATPVLSNALAGFRKLSGCTDTNNNRDDFTTAVPAPRNSASPTNVCNPAVVTSLSLVASASPTTILTTGTTTLSANASGGTAPYTYSFAGPGTITPSGNTATVSGLVSGMQTFTLTATDATAPTGQMISATLSVTVNEPASTTTTAPFAITGVTTVSCQTLSAGERSLSFTPHYSGGNGQPITFSVVNELLPTTTAGPYTLRLYTDNPTITLKATQTGTTGEVSFVYNWLAACGAPAPGPGGFAIASVSTTACEVLSPGERRVTFTPVYSGASGSPISFSVVNELPPTTAPGPYVLRLYTDNPVITLRASQSGLVATFGYQWLAACGSGSPRLGVAELAAPLRVTVLGNPLQDQSVRVRVAGTCGQALRLLVTEVGGNVIAERFSQSPASSEEYVLELGGRGVGTLLLRASTPSQAQTVKLIKP